MLAQRAAKQLHLRRQRRSAGSHRMAQWGGGSKSLALGQLLTGEPSGFGPATCPEVKVERAAGRRSPRTSTTTSSGIRPSAARGSGPSPGRRGAGSSRSTDDGRAGPRPVRAEPDGPSARRRRPYRALQLALRATHRGTFILRIEDTRREGRVRRVEPVPFSRVRKTTPSRRGRRAVGR
jgi:hypothetical protein